MTMQETAIQYFQAFAAKDVKALAALLAEDVSLRDWEISAQGRDAVLAANQNIFRQVGSIAVTPLHLWVNGSMLAAELAIAIEGVDTVKVVDILEFNAQGQICAVRAFKG